MTDATPDTTPTVNPFASRPSIWPEACPRCGAEYADGIGCVLVDGVLFVRGISMHGLVGDHFISYGDQMIDMVPDAPEAYRKPFKSVRDFGQVVRWNTEGQCSECGGIVQSSKHQEADDE